MSTTLPKLVLVGIHGHGQAHLRRARTLADKGAAVISGLVDIRPPEDVELRDLWSPTLAEALASRPDAVVICTPIHTHAALTIESVAAGCDVLLEKPPAPTWAAFQQTLLAVSRSQRHCQVGFQSLGSAAVPELRDALRSGRLGEPHSVCAAGSWTRDSTYYGRADWAGRRSLNGQPVVDGALTNPFAHAVATSLAIAGAEAADAIAAIDVELYHANPIEADDTSCLRVRTASGLPVTVAVTLCAEEETLPWIEVRGSTGSARLYYTTDQVDWSVDGRTWTEHYERTDLLTDLLAGGPLLAPLERTAGFMRVLEAIRTAPDPAPVPEAYLRTTVHAGATKRVIPGIAEAVVTAARAGSTLRDAGVAWARE